ncbi:hypothetical protein HPG69_006929 [Diceros bicornis minor]|uniref:Uncharacterized protein n=1 Tax=Diceros bicornis minor TaxID=77932 RepID=A0A7J7F9S0_DICBM|nr:hypothetical protein HPG69_006929 [Diceros bicornis minor]
MRTLKRLQKLVRTKKARVPSLDETKPTLINLQDEDETLISCVKLAKSQEKKVSNVSTRRKEEMEMRLDSISPSLVRSSTSTACSLAEMLSHNEGEVQMWNSWKPFPENPLWPCVDFPIGQAEPWDNCSRCAHHPPLKSSSTDMGLPHSWWKEEDNERQSEGGPIMLLTMKDLKRLFTYSLTLHMVQSKSPKLDIDPWEEKGLML